MKNQLSILLLLCIPIFLCSQKTIPQTNEVIPVWRYGFSIGAFNTGVSPSGKMGNIDQSAGISFNYQLAIYRKLSPHFFIETGLGFNNIKRIQEIRGNYIYTENNADLIGTSTFENEYSTSLTEGAINYDIEFKVRTTKYDAEGDFEEGELIPLSFKAEHHINHAIIPIRFNYKFSKRKLSIFTGLGLAANILTQEKVDLESLRQYGLSLGDRRYKPEIYPFGPSQSRNVLQSWDVNPTNSPNKFFLDAMVNFGLIHEHWRNTFLLYINYHHSLTNFYGNAKLEQVGIKVGWRYSLASK